jgi:hypothetical protein
MHITLRLRCHGKLYLAAIAATFKQNGLMPTSHPHREVSSPAVPPNGGDASCLSRVLLTNVTIDFHNPWISFWGAFHQLLGTFHEQNSH